MSGLLPSFLRGQQQQQQPTPILERGPNYTRAAPAVAPVPASDTRRASAPAIANLPSAPNVIPAEEWSRRLASVSLPHEYRPKDATVFSTNE